MPKKKFDYMKMPYSKFRIFRKRKNKCFYWVMCTSRNRKNSCKGCKDYIRITKKNKNLSWTYYKDKRYWSKKDIKQDIKIQNKKRND